MLVLTRKVNQSLIIGNDIEIKVLEIRKDGVRLGIIAPQNVGVFRQEVYEEIQRENIASSMVDAQSIEQMSKIFKKPS